MLSDYLINYFKLSQRQTTLRIEIVAGLTTFLTMAYVIVVNPNILAAAGMNGGAVFVATCLAAALGCFIMGVFANYPIALAPSMGLNVYFTYFVVQKLGYPWQVALGTVFISGVIFLFLTIFGIRQKIIHIIPDSLKHGTSVGIGLFLIAIALQNIGLITIEPGFSLHLTTLLNPTTWLVILGVLLIALLDHYKILGAIVIGILAVTVTCIAFGITSFQGVVAMPPSITPTWMSLHLSDLFHIKLLVVILTFFFVTLFDNASSLITLLQQAKLISPNGNIPHLTKALISDSTATMVGAFLGTSTIGNYIESAAGIRAGGRTGITTIVVGSLFLLALCFSPLTKTIPVYATASALIYVGFLITSIVREFNWNNMDEAIPALITALTIPATFSIARGVAYGFLSYVVLQLLLGRARQINFLLAALTVVFASYLFL